MWANITTQTTFQRWVPSDLIGRLSGILLTSSYGMFPISVALAGSSSTGSAPAPSSSCPR
jgi:hypothetical protein